MKIIMCLLVLLASCKAAKPVKVTGDKTFTVEHDPRTRLLPDTNGN